MTSCRGSGNPQLHRSVNVTSKAPFANLHGRNQYDISTNEFCGNCGRLNLAAFNKLSVSGTCLKRCGFVQVFPLGPLILRC